MIQVLGSYFMKKDKIYRILSKLFRILYFVSIFTSMKFVEGCFPTSPGGPPVITTTALPGTCCPELVQTLTQSAFADGDTFFVYNDDACRTSAVVTCQQPQGQNLDLFAGIVVNLINFVDYAADTVTFPATCNNGVWQMGNPPLTVMTLECLLTDPP